MLNDEHLDINILAEESKELLSILKSRQDPIEQNQQTPIISMLTPFIISSSIIPFIEPKELLSFRAVCRDFNSYVGNTVALVSYYKSINKNKANSKVIENKVEIKKLEDLTDRT